MLRFALRAARIRAINGGPAGLGGGSCRGDSPRIGSPGGVAGGGVLQVRVSVDLNLRDTVILVQGESRALDRRLRWLDATFRDPSTGSTLTVSTVRTHPMGDIERDMLLADVQSCGAGPTADEDISANARNDIGTGKFALQGIENSAVEAGRTSASQGA